MKICPTCASTAFDDMPICYGCLQPFYVDVQEIMSDSGFSDFSDEFIIEEPHDELSWGLYRKQHEAVLARQNRQL